MSRASVSVQVNIEQSWLDEPIGEAIEGALNVAMVKSATLVQAVWVGRAQQLDIRQSGAYIAGLQGDGSITVVKPVEADGPTAIVGEIKVSATAPHSQIVEDGHEAFHLPSRINWAGPRVKQGKNGPYLSIPFRHTAYAEAGEREAGGYTRASVKAMMPEQIYKQAKRLKRTTKTNEGPIRAPGGQFLHADRYNYGGRLKRGNVQSGFSAAPGQAAGEERRGERTVGHVYVGRTMGLRSGKLALTNPEWKTSKYEGMMKSGPRGHSQYMTIRVITPRSRGWNIPAQPGYGIGRQVASETAPMVEDIAANAIIEALENL